MPDPISEYESSYESFYTEKKRAGLLRVVRHFFVKGEASMRENTLEQMKNVDINTVDLAELVDICEIQTDQQKTREERLQDFVVQVKNPYCFRVGKGGRKR